MNQQTDLTNEHINKGIFENSVIVISFLLLFDSMHLIFARMLRPYLSSSVAAFYVLGIAAVQIFVFLSYRRAIDWRVLRRHWWFFAVIGLLVALSTWLNYLAIRFIDPGTAALLSRSTTIFAIVLGLVWLRERLTPMEWLGAAVALIGVATISFQPGDYLRIGSLFVLGASFFYAIHAAVVKRYGGEMDFANFFLFRVGATAFFLLLFVVGQGSMVMPSGPAWLILLLTATVDVIFSRVLYYWALRKVEMTYHSIILMMSPVVTVLWSFLFFREWPTVQAVIGGMGVISGLAIVTWDRQRRRNATQKV